MVLPDLGGHVALGLYQVGQRRVFRLDALQRARHPHRRQAGAHRKLTCDERGSPGGATRLSVRVGEQGALIGDPVDIRRPAPHDSSVVAPTSNQPMSSAMINRMFGLSVLTSAPVPAQ